MPEDTTETTDTTAPEGTQTPEGATPALGSDGTPLDPIRQQELIVKLRGIEHAGKARDLAQGAAIRALLAAGPLTPTEQATVDAAKPAADAAPMYEQTLRDVGRLLGLTDEAITAPGGPDALVSAARASRLSAEVGEAITSEAAPRLTPARASNP
jgi:hypothetical protein